MTRSPSRLPLLWASLLLVHTLVTIPTLLEVGYVGLLQHALASWPGRQVLSDLVVALVPLLVVLRDDAAQQRKAFWPVLVGTALLGSFAPLTWLLWRDLRGTTA